MFLGTVEPPARPRSFTTMHPWRTIHLSFQPFVPSCTFTYSLKNDIHSPIRKTGVWKVTCTYKKAMRDENIKKGGVIKAWGHNQRIRKYRSGRLESRRRFRRPWSDGCKSPVVRRRQHTGAWTWVPTYRCHPLFTSATHPRPVIVANLGTAFLVGADDLAGELAVREHRFHPFHLGIGRQFQTQRKGTQWRHYRFYKVTRAFRVDQDRRAQGGSGAVQPSHGQARRRAQRGELCVGRELRREVGAAPIVAGVRRRPEGQRGRGARDGVGPRGRRAVRRLLGGRSRVTRHALLECM